MPVNSSLDERCASMDRGVKGALRGGRAGFFCPARHANLPQQEDIMGTRISTLLILVVLAAVTVRSQQAGPTQQPAEPQVVPLKKFPMNQRFETVSGDPAKSGGLYVIRIHAEAGYIIMPHTHPEDENIVVVKGSWAVGMG